MAQQLPVLGCRSCQEGRQARLLRNRDSLLEARSCLLSAAKLQVRRTQPEEGFCALVRAPGLPTSIDRGFEMADRSCGRAVDQVQPPQRTVDRRQGCVRTDALAFGLGA